MNKSKFNVNTTSQGKVKRTFEGVLFDSEIEMRFYRDYLLDLKNKGEIVNIIMQPKYTLQPKYEKNGKKILPIFYVADFELEYSNGNVVIVDIKGMATPEAKLKRKIFNFIYPDKTLLWISYSRLDGGWVEVEKIDAGRKERKKSKKIG